MSAAYSLLQYLKKCTIVIELTTNHDGLVTVRFLNMTMWAGWMTGVSLQVLLKTTYFTLYGLFLTESTVKTYNYSIGISMIGVQMSSWLLQTSLTIVSNHPHFLCILFKKRRFHPYIFFPRIAMLIIPQTLKS